MARVSHYIVAGTILLVSLNGAAAAGQLTYRPINPSFGGDPFNSAHLLGIANANDRYEVLKAVFATNLDTVLGKVSFDANGDLTDKTISVFQIKQDKAIPPEDMRQYHYIGVAPSA